MTVPNRTTMLSSNYPASVAISSATRSIEREQTMNNNEIYQPAIRIEIPPIPSLPTETTDGFYRMREWQKRCFDALRDSRNWIIKALMASGKSFEICAIAADAL